MIINFRLVTYRLSSSASFLASVTDRTRLKSFESWFPRLNRRRRFRPKPCTLSASWKSSLTRRRSRILCPRFPRTLESNRAWLIQIPIGRRGCKNTKSQSVCTRASCPGRRCYYRPRTNTNGLDARWQSYTRFDTARIAYRQPVWFQRGRGGFISVLHVYIRARVSVAFSLCLCKKNSLSSSKRERREQKKEFSFIWVGRRKKHAPVARKIYTDEPSRGYSPR